MHLFELPFCIFLNLYPPVQNWDSTDVDEPPTNSLLLESILLLRWEECMEFWLEQGLEGCSIPKLLSIIFVNFNEKTDKGYRIASLTSPMEIKNDEKLKENDPDILRTISEHTNSIWICNNIQQDLNQIKIRCSSPQNYYQRYISDWESHWIMNRTKKFEQIMFFKMLSCYDSFLMI